MEEADGDDEDHLSGLPRAYLARDAVIHAILKGAKMPVAVVYSDMRAGNKAQSSQAVIVQAHCNAVSAQSFVDLTPHPTLKNFHTQINESLSRAKDNSTRFLNQILPGIVTTVDDIRVCFAMQSAIARLVSDPIVMETAEDRLYGQRAARVEQLPQGRSRSSVFDDDLLSPQYWANNRLSRIGAMASCRNHPAFYGPAVCAAIQQGDALDIARRGQR